MALIFCSECGNKISEEAKTCPKCGISKRSGRGNFRWLGIIGVIGVLMIGLLLTWDTLFVQPETSDEWLEKINISEQILNDNKDDLINVMTKKMQRKGPKVITKMVLEDRLGCMVDTLSVRMAEKHSLQV